MFAALAENVRDYAVFLLDPDGIVIYWGEGARLMKWWTADEVEGAHLRAMYLDGGSEDGTAEEHLQSAAERGEYTGEGQRVRSDGSTFWAGVALTALRDADGTLLGFAKVTRDLTARHAAEAALRAASESAEALRAGQEANRSRAEFLTTLSHEIRTPVNAIIGYADLLEMETAGSLASEQRAHVERIRSSGRHLLGLVNDTLDLSRMEADRMPFGGAVERIGPAVEGALALVEPQAKAKTLRLANEISGSAADTPYYGDEERVRQIVVNLLGNAVKFTPGGGRITVSAGTAEHASPEADLKGPGPWAWIRVEDTGPGIPPERLAAIFEPFEQADMSGGQHGGSGLGVTISRRLARLMGGDITARSEVGLGTSFFLWLPAVGSMARQPRPEASLDGAAATENEQARPGSRPHPEDTDRQDTSRAQRTFLAEASRCLADSLDYETTLETVAGLALPLLGSWSIVDLVSPDGSVRRLSIVHADPAQQAIARELKEGWPPLRDDPMGVPVVARTRRAEVVPEITEAFLVSVARTEENLARLRALGMSSLITVPMSARGRVLGAITFVTSSAGRRFDKADMSVAEDLAARCGIAIDNARLHRAALALVEAERASARKEAEEQIKTELLATASHELRTPLNIMAGYLELLTMEIAGPLTTTQKHYVERVRAGEKQLLRIVEDMLNFVRLHEKKVEYHLDDVGLCSVVEDASGAYRQSFEENGLELVTRCEPGVCAHADPAKVWQILMNLLSNARKFSEAGGEVAVECRMDGDRPTIRVRDTGQGIPPEKLDSVFEPFVQGDGSLTRPAEGMGLGLSVSRQLARDMAGDLTVESTIGVGSTFVLSLAPVQES
ncbi:MAG TPA: ATP-binding protein [Longimicrobiaceae bacterium]|nr:ATP-binding protein [Longimicrobiaceae bacterium]